MAKSVKATELEDTLRDIYDLVQESGTTRASMESSLDSIADLCTDAIPQLDESETEDEETEDEEN
jgi:hypothetical protein